jgi:hypothetical protein
LNLFLKQRIDFDVAYFIHLSQTQDFVAYWTEYKNINANACSILKQQKDWLNEKTTKSQARQSTQTGCNMYHEDDDNYSKTMT